MRDYAIEEMYAREVHWIIDLEADHRPGSWVEEKMINGCGPYRYLRWRDNTGRKRSKYLGRVRSEPV